jgi:hypothetical protein
VSTTDPADPDGGDKERRAGEAVVPQQPVCREAAPAGLLADAVGHERDHDDAGQPYPAYPRVAGERGQAGDRVAGDRRDHHSQEGERGRAEHEQPPGPRSPDIP